MRWERRPRPTILLPFETDYKLGFPGPAQTFRPESIAADSRQEGRRSERTDHAVWQQLENGRVVHRYEWIVLAATLAAVTAGPSRAKT
jgi:hypothetical protein